jgi:autotransporter-associated beta strand protein
MQSQSCNQWTALRGAIVITMMTIAVALLTSASSEASTYRWKVNQGGNWTDRNNWDLVPGGNGNDDGYPNAVGDVAEFTQASIDHTEILFIGIPDGETITVGAIVIETDVDFVIAPGAERTGKLVFANGEAAALLTVNDLQIPLQIDVPVELKSALVVDVIQGDFSLRNIMEAGGSRTLTKKGPGSLTFRGENSYTGVTTIEEGHLFLSGDAGPYVPGDLVIGAGVATDIPKAEVIISGLPESNHITDVGRVWVRADGLLRDTNGQALQAGPRDQADTFAERIGDLVVDDGAVLLFESEQPAPSLIARSLTMTGGRVDVGNGREFVIEGSVTATSSAKGSAVIRSEATDGTGSLDLLDATRTFAVNDGPAPVDLEIGLAVTGTGTAGFIKHGPGVLRFTGQSANTYPGTTIVRQGRFELARGPGVLMGPGLSVPGALLIGTGQGAAVVSVMAGGNISPIGITVGPDGLLAGNGVLDAFASVTVNGGSVTLGDGGTPGTWFLQHLIMDGGTIALSDRSVLSVAELTATSGPTQTPVIHGDGFLRFDPVLGLSLAIADGPQAIDLRIDAHISNASAFGVRKRGTGVVQIAGTGSYATETTVEQGALCVTGTLPNSPIVLSGGTLCGTGVVGTVMATSGAIAPGLSPGRLAAHSIELAASATFAIELNGTTAGADYDQLAVEDTVTLGQAALALSIAPGFVPPVDSAFTILDNAGTDAIAGTFAGLAEGSTIAVGARQFTVSYRGGDGNDIVLTSVTPLTWFLAEGATGTFFDDDVLIVNPNDAETPVTLTFLQEGGATVVEKRTIAAQSRMTVHVDQIKGLENTSASVQVVSDKRLPLVVERSMFWNASYYGGHTATAVALPETRWIFAEGSQGSFFDTYILIANVNAEATTATLTFLRENDAQVQHMVEIAPFARKTIHVKDVPGVVGAFGIVVDATRPVIAERAMYFATLPGKQWTGGHVNTGIAAPSTTWFHAEGATGTYFNTFILLSNPQDTAAQVELRFLLDTGEVITRKKTLAPRQRMTINPATEDDVRLENAALSTVVQSDVPIVSERSMYWQGDAEQFGEGHNSSGVVSTATRWGLAEGRIGGPREFVTYILLANPSTTAAEVTITYLRESGAPIVKTYTVPPTSRYNVDVKFVVPELQDASFGARIDVTNNIPIAVERSVYWNANGVSWAGGSNALATPLP